MEDADIADTIEAMKVAREHLPVGYPETIVCYRKTHEFLLSASAPPEADGSTTMLAACIPVVEADETVYVREVQARPEGFDRSIPVGEDPNAVPALLIVFSDRLGLRDWRLLSYGITDEGNLDWLGSIHDQKLTAPEVTEILGLLDEVYPMGDLISERDTLLWWLQANDYHVLAHRRIMEGS